MRRGPNFTLRDRGVNACLAYCLNSVLNVIAVVAAFNQEKALVGAFSVITNLRMDLFEALDGTRAIQVTDTRRAKLTEHARRPRHAVSEVSANFRSEEKLCCRNQGL